LLGEPLLPLGGRDGSRAGRIVGGVAEVLARGGAEHSVRFHAGFGVACFEQIHQRRQGLAAAMIGQSSSRRCLNLFRRISQQRQCLGIGRASQNVF
jgi:hypothetical protein